MLIASEIHIRFGQTLIRRPGVRDRAIFVSEIGSSGWNRTSVRRMKNLQVAVESEERLEVERFVGEANGEGLQKRWVIRR